MGIKVGINGFGRIGRNVLRILLQNPDKFKDVEVVGINDLTNAAMLAHLFKYDSVHRIFDGTVSSKEGAIVINGKEIKVHSQKDAKALPWKADGVDVVVEATGRYRDKEGCMAHIDAGAKKVIITAPSKNEDLTVVLGVNEDKYDAAKHVVLSNASCTTNCLAPVAKVINDSFGIERGLMTTIHSYTNDQRILDLPHEDFRRARAAALSMIPTTTGAAKAVGLVIPELKGKVDGLAIRVPTPNVSVVDFVCSIGKEASKDDVIGALKSAAAGKMKGILDVCDTELVSVDFLGNSFSSIVDVPASSVLDKRLVKIISWYDNEWGYSFRVCDLIKFIMK